MGRCYSPCRPWRVSRRRKRIPGSRPCSGTASTCSARARPTSAPEIDWTRDFKTRPLGGRCATSRRCRSSYGDGSDIKVPWELSRFQHLPLLAAAHRLTGDARFLDELAAQLANWIAANPVELGPNWACTMDVAIRAANWVAALGALRLSGGPRPWLDARSRPAAARALHPLAPRVGRGPRQPLPLGRRRAAPGRGAVLGQPRGPRLGEWAAGELEREMATRCAPTAATTRLSIPYHRLVCELFVCGAQPAGRAGARRDSRRSSANAWTRCSRSSADYTRPDGLAPQVGDADDGRFLPLGDYGAPTTAITTTSSARRGAAAPDAGRHAAYPDGRLLRAAIGRPVGARALRRRRPSRARRPRATTTSCRSSSPPRTSRWLSTPAPTSTRPIRPSATASAPPRPTRRCTWTARSRTRCAATTSSRWPIVRVPNTVVGLGRVRRAAPRVPGRDPHTADRARRSGASDPRHG